MDAETSLAVTCNPAPGCMKLSGWDVCASLEDAIPSVVFCQPSQDSSVLLVSLRHCPAYTRPSVAAPRRGGVNVHRAS